MELFKICPSHVRPPLSALNLEIAPEDQHFQITETGVFENLQFHRKFFYNETNYNKDEVSL
jgi:hypothetical protein